MLLGEPPPSQGDLHFSLFGIPVRVHPFFWIVTGVLGLRGTDTRPEELLIWIGAVFVSILIHEMGHAFAALAHGWKPWITLYGLGGLASYQPTRQDARSQIIISFAGPAAGFLFIALVMSMVHASHHEVYVGRANLLPYWVFFQPFASDNLNSLIGSLLFINIFWGLVNLLPVYPLDGGRISREVFVHFNAQEGVTQSLWLSVFTGVGLAVFGLVTLRSPFMAMFFGYMAYTSYSMLQMYSGRGGGFGTRGW